MNSAAITRPFSRSLTRHTPSSAVRCSWRSLSTTCCRPSGHSRWSKIKHDKAKVDAGVSKQRSFLARSIINAVKIGGPDPTTNGRLAAMLVEAKKAELPKASVEKAIARGQGISATGVPLETLVMEFMMPPGVGGILEIETDNRRRTTAEVKEALRACGGTPSPSAFLFDRRGKIVFADNGSGGLTEEAVLESAIEAGALDVETVQEEDREGDSEEFIVWTEVSDMTAVTGQLEKALGSSASSQDLVYKPKEDTRTSPDGEALDTLLSKLDNITEIQNIYLNTV